MKTLHSTKRASVLISLLAIFFACILSACLLQTNSKAYAEDESCFMGANVVLTEDIVVKYTVKLPEGAENSATFNYRGTDYVVAGEETEGGLYVFAFDKVTPEYLGETIVATVGEETKEYSVKQYLYTLLDEGINELAEKQGYSAAKISAMQSLVVDLLNYGTAAQEYNGITENLANADLTDEQKAYATVYETPESIGEYTATKEVTFKSAGLYCGSALSAYFKVNIPADKSASDYTLNVNGTVLKASSTEENVATYVYRNITPLQFDDALVATVYEGETAVSDPLTYSVNTYVSRMENSAKTGALAKAISSYGKSATAFVNALSSKVTLAPTETTTGTLTVWQNGVEDTVELPVLSLENENYEYVSTVYDTVANEGIGTFKILSTKIGEYDLGRVLSFEVVLDHFIGVKDGDSETHYSVYDMDDVGTNVTGARIDGVATLVLTGDATIDAQIGFAGGKIAIASPEGENHSLTMSNVFQVWDEVVIKENATINVETGGDAVYMQEGATLTIDGALNISGSDNVSWKSAIKYQANNATVVVNGKVNIADKGIGVYMYNGLANSNFTVNGAANVTVNTYGHGIVGNGTSDVVNVNGGTTSISSGNAFLCEHNGLTVNVKAGTLSTMGNVGMKTLNVSGGATTFGSTTEDSNQITAYTNEIKNIAMIGTATEDGTSTTAGTLNVYNTLKTENIVMKDGTLNVTVNLGIWGTQPHAIYMMLTDANRTYNSILIGGTINVVSVAGTLDAAIGNKDGASAGNWVVAIGGLFNLDVNNAVFGAHRDQGNAKAAAFEFTHYNGGNACVGSDNCNAHGLEKGSWGLSGFEYWSTISQASYWTRYGVNIAEVGELTHKELSVANKCGAVDWSKI